MRTRKNAVIIRLNDEELSALNLNTEKSGLPREEYIRRTLKGKIIREKPPADFSKWISEIRRIGQNISRILQIAYSKKLLDVPKIRRSLDELDRLEKAMWEEFFPEGFE